MIKFAILTILILIHFTFAFPLSKDDSIVFINDDDDFVKRFVYKSDVISLDSDENVSNKLVYGDLFEGDIILPDDQMDYVMSHRNFTEEDPGNLTTRTGLMSGYYRWPKNVFGAVVIPYVIDSRSGYCECS